jgi:hypothetical protein
VHARSSFSSRLASTYAHLSAEAHRHHAAHWCSHDSAGLPLCYFKACEPQSELRQEDSRWWVSFLMSLAEAGVVSLGDPCMLACSGYQEGGKEAIAACNRCFH